MREGRERSKIVRQYFYKIFLGLGILFIVCMTGYKLREWYLYKNELVTLEITNNEASLEECEEYDLHFKIVNAFDKKMIGELVLPDFGSKSISSTSSDSVYLHIIASGYLTRSGHKVDYYGCQFAKEFKVVEIDTSYCE